jgi:hypothetical protein
MQSNEFIIGINNTNTISIILIIYTTLIIVYKFIKTIQKESMNTSIHTLIEEIHTHNQLLLINYDYLSKIDYISINMNDLQYYELNQHNQQNIQDINNSDQLYCDDSHNIHNSDSSDSSIDTEYNITEYGSYNKKDIKND